MTEPDLDQGIKTQYAYAATIDAGQIHTDQTGRFPVVSSKGNNYIMILYDYDSNAFVDSALFPGTPAGHHANSAMTGKPSTATKWLCLERTLFRAPHLTSLSSHKLS
jgi:hypothetical protein